MWKNLLLAMLAIDGTGFDWSYMADEEASTNFALMAFSDSEVQNNKTCSKTCLKIFKDLKSRYDKLKIELNKSESDLDSYKKGLASVEEQLVFYKKNESMLCDQIVVLKRDASFNELDIIGLRNRLEKFKQPEFEGYGVKVNKGASENVSKEVKKTSDAPIIEDWVSDCDEDETVVKRFDKFLWGNKGLKLPVKPTAYWAWRPKIKMINHVYKNTGSCISLATPGQTATGKESSNPFMAGSLPKTISPMIHLCQKSKESHVQSLTMLVKKVKRLEDKLKVMISDAKEYLILEDPVKQGRMEETENA
ncbi:hypothetical protein Tco_0803684 [Tanacetum coccineum]|uniref:Uncharacterized protein n=1 Tax=Tanacetum coccineum TaxID=301880 RepID=A0ABQ5A4Q6_9ASTR